MQVETGHFVGRQDAVVLVVAFRSTPGGFGACQCDARTTHGVGHVLHPLAVVGDAGGVAVVGHEKSVGGQVDDFGLAGGQLLEGGFGGRRAFADGEVGGGEAVFRQFAFDVGQFVARERQVLEVFAADAPVVEVVEGEVVVRSPGFVRTSAVGQ